MSNIKRVISMLLAAAMILSMSTFVAFDIPVAFWAVLPAKEL